MNSKYCALLFNIISTLNPYGQSEDSVSLNPGFLDSAVEYM